MKRVAFFDAKPYDKRWFDSINDVEKKYEIVYFEVKLSPKTALLASGFDAVCAFVNDDISKCTIDILYEMGIRVLAMRCAGTSNVDLRAAEGRIEVLRVPAYSPHAVAEHAMALLLTLNRKLHKAYNRTRDFNFSLIGLMGNDLHGKTAGVIGTGKIGRVFIDICKGFGMKVLGYDLYPAKDSGIDYVPLETLLRESDVISLHCPLTDQTKHIINEKAFSIMKRGVFIINTSRGALIDSTALLSSLKSGVVRGAGLDVYEEEADFFYEDHSDIGVKDDVLALLVSAPGVIVTSHQGFFTEEAMENISKITIENLNTYFGI